MKLLFCGVSCYVNVSLSEVCFLEKLFRLNALSSSLYRFPPARPLWSQSTPLLLAAPPLAWSQAVQTRPRWRAWESKSATGYWSMPVDPNPRLSWAAVYFTLFSSCYHNHPSISVLLKFTHVMFVNENQKLLPNSIHVYMYLYIYLFCISWGRYVFSQK